MLRIRNRRVQREIRRRHIAGLLTALDETERPALSPGCNCMANGPVARAPLRNLLFCLSMPRTHWFTCSAAILLALLTACCIPQTIVAQQTASPPAEPGAGSANPEFLAAVDEVIKEMSDITGWQLKTPLKKSIRTRAEIRAYVLQQMDDEKDAKERYASARTAEAFGLIPKGFNLDSFLVDLLTEQIAGLYDPKAHEFYIADWIAPDEQRMVMSHELTHALQDQYFHIEDWVHAARPNDDAELARESVLEGSAMAGMLEYELRDKGLKLKDLPDFDPSIFVGDLADTPMLKKAPPFIKDSLLFPYFSGLTFSLTILRAGGWKGFDHVFANPPAGTQQIMHPTLYREGKAPGPLKVDLPDGVPSAGWNELEEDCMGEFGWKEILKQFLDDDRAKKVAAGWDGDDYITFEHKDKKALMVFARLRFNNEDMASDFFDAYSSALAKKYRDPKNVMKADQFVAFDSVDGRVFLRCVAKECVTAQGTDSSAFAKWTQKLGWPAASAVDQTTAWVPSQPQLAAAELR
jgi:hypothetical protein